MDQCKKRVFSVFSVFSVSTKESAIKLSGPSTWHSISRASVNVKLKNDYSDYQPHQDHQAELGHFICLNCSHCLNLRLVKAARSFMETLPASFLAVHWRHGALPCNAMQSISGFILFETRSCSTLYFFLLHPSLAFFSSISLW
jgi:hypothetical protein